MKSYKCEYCNLTNWIDVVVCKRCQMPNSFLPEHEGINDNQVTEQSNPELQYQEEGLPQMAPIQSQFDSNQTHQDNLNYSNPNQPPPPNVYGQRAGNTNYDDGFGQDQMYNSGGYQQVIPHEVDSRFNEAISNMNSAFKAGKVYCIICGVFVVLLGLLFILAAGASSSSNVNTAAAGGILAVAMGFLAVIIGIIYGLSRGIKNKSRACAVILVVLFGFGLLMNVLGLLAGGGIGKNGVSLIISVIWVYYFSLGLKGTFAYHDIVQQYPSLKQ